MVSHKLRQHVWQHLASDDRHQPGIEQVANFFKKSANKLVKADNLRVFVMVDPAGQLIGFYAINAHKIDYTELPPK